MKWEKGKRIFVCAAVTACAAGVICVSGCKKSGDTETGGVEENPASSVVMTGAQAESLANAVSVKLYYKTADAESLAAETALMEFNRHDKKVSSLAGDILTKLMEGPVNGANFKSLIPEGTEVRSVGLKNGTLKIDVNKAFVDGIAEDAERARLVVFSVVNTVTELKDIERVEFTCGGEPIGTLACGFEFKTFERDLSMLKSDTQTGAGGFDPYAEELYENVTLE